MWVVLAGGESWANLLLDLGVRNQLFSYFYFRTSLHSSSHKTLALMARMKRAKAKGYRFWLDSGAFTFQTKANKGANLPPPAAYFEEYFNFVISNHHLFDMIAEFDVDNYVKVDSAGNVLSKNAKEGRLITTPEVDEWTNRMLDVPELRKKIMPVFHVHRGMRWYYEWLIDTRSPLVGITSEAEASSNLIGLAHRYGKFIHGFGQTRIKTDLRYMKFDSVDSTTWLRADKYGGTMIFQNNRLIILDHLHKANRRIYRSFYERWGLDFGKIMKDDLEENRRATIVSWRELANAFERKADYLSGGKKPYLWEMHEAGRVPAVHPLVTRAQ